MPRQGGVLITDVPPGGPAAAAGLQVNDIILSINGRLMDAVPAMLGVTFEHPAGDQLHLQILRGNREMDFQITSVEQPHGVDRLVDLADPTTDAVSELGIVGLTTNKRVEEILGSLRLPLGVAVAALIPTRSGIATGLQLSDVIHSVNGDFVNSLPDLRARMAQFKSGDPVALLVERAGQFQYLTFEAE